MATLAKWGYATSPLCRQCNLACVDNAARCILVCPHAAALRTELGVASMEQGRTEHGLRGWAPRPQLDELWPGRLERPENFVLTYTVDGAEVEAFRFARRQHLRRRLVPEPTRGDHFGHRFLVRPEMRRRANSRDLGMPPEVDAANVRLGGEDRHHDGEAPPRSRRLRGVL